MEPLLFLMSAFPGSTLVTEEPQRRMQVRQIRQQRKLSRKEARELADRMFDKSRPAKSAKR